jgi:hypothetical protein
LFSYVGFEVYTAVVMKSTVFWDTIASIFRVEELAEQETSVLVLYFDPEDGSDMFIRNGILLSNGLQALHPTRW